MELSTWIAFFAASWAISLSPGAGAVAAMSAGLQHGFARGYFMTFGLVIGIWTQVVVVVVGLGALIATSALAFSVIKWAGVAYLIWLGVKQWRAPATPMVADSGDHTPVSRWTLFLRGWGVNAVNPKGTVFLLAVVPQFLDLSQPLGAAVPGDRRHAGLHRPGGDGRLHRARRPLAAPAQDAAPDACAQPRLRQPLCADRGDAGDLQARLSRPYSAIRPRPALMPARCFLPSSRRCFEP